MPVPPLQGRIIVTEGIFHFLDHATHVVCQTEEGTVMLGDSQEDVGLPRPPRRQHRPHLGRSAPDLARRFYEQSERYPVTFAATCHSGITRAGAHALALAPAILKGRRRRNSAFHSRRFRGELSA
jgi:hypothetical protein